MSNTYFQFKQFKIEQDRCAMKVGTDGVLLGSWTDPSSATSILDIGTGTGLLALMLAQRSRAFITAIEIDESAALQAQQNVSASLWKDRIAVKTCSLQNYSAANNEKFDLIVSNPPYFRQSLKNPDEKKSLARHSDTLSYDDLLKGVLSLLAEDGLFTVVLPFNEGELFIQMAENNGLFCIRRTDVIPVPDAPVKRLLLSFSKVKQSCLKDQLVIEIGGRHCYSEEYKNLTKDYYL